MEDMKVKEDFSCIFYRLPPSRIVALPASGIAQAQPAPLF